MPKITKAALGRISVIAAVLQFVAAVLLVFHFGIHAEFCYDFDKDVGKPAKTDVDKMKEKELLYACAALAASCLIVLLFVSLLQCYKKCAPILNVILLGLSVALDIAEIVLSGIMLGYYGTSLDKCSYWEKTASGVDIFKKGSDYGTYGELNMRFYFVVLACVILSFLLTVILIIFSLWCDVDYGLNKRQDVESGDYRVYMHDNSRFAAENPISEKDRKNNNDLKKEPNSEPRDESKPKSEARKSHSHLRSISKRTAAGADIDKKHRSSSLRRQDESFKRHLHAILKRKTSQKSDDKRERSKNSKTWHNELRKDETPNKKGGFFSSRFGKSYK